MKLTVKNISDQPGYVNTVAEGRVELKPGDTLTDIDVPEFDARNIAANTDMFKVTGYVDPDAEPTE